MTTVLVVAAHPDDEVLGCGGTLARHAAKGDVVNILILAEGATSRAEAPGAGKEAGTIAALREAAAKAAKILGAQPPRFAGLPDNKMDSLPLLEVVKEVEKIIAETRPSIVYTHHHGDLNIDHRITHQAALTACRPLPGAPVKALYGFETLSSTEWAGPEAQNAFCPQHFCDISQQLAAKLEALRCYNLEMRPFPHPRSFEAVEALARLRGASAGLTAAEAFETIRCIT